MTAPIPLSQWRAMLAAEAARITREATQVVRVGSQKIKNEGRQNSLASSGRSRRAAQTIQYDVTIGPGPSITGAISYAGGGMANLGTLLEFGGGRDHSPPHRDLGRALDAEEPRFVTAMANVAAIGSVTRQT